MLQALFPLVALSATVSGPPTTIVAGTSTATVATYTAGPITAKVVAESSNGKFMVAIAGRPARTTTTRTVVTATKSRCA
ncbi:hypothetical protein C8Q76DRAFT_727363 [Earliella scabrosa]|nr:hypothetical protein C8Q76DRAFT_727363 [Earliella scabrosa]